MCYNRQSARHPSPLGRSGGILGSLSFAECNVLRGLAIIGIFLHNYCHWLNPIVKENEYTFKEHNVNWFRQVVLHPDALLPMHLVSFFGHYGVPIFLFLSAYGLMKKYGGDKSSPASFAPSGKGKAEATSGISSSLSFILSHFLKLFRMMILGFIAFIIVDAMTPGSWNYTVEKVVAQLLMYNNLLPNPDRMIWPGPYWFFGLMLQLYIVYRLLLHRRHVAFTIVLMTVCVAVQLMLEPDGSDINRYRYNFMGGMLPFGLGLLYARYEGWLNEEKMTRGKLFIRFLICTMLVICLSVSFFWWTFVPVAVCGASLYLVKWMGSVGWMSGVMKVLHWMGIISAALFVTHPIVRKVVIPISRRGDMYTGLVIYIVAAILLAWLFHLLMKKIPTLKRT